MYVDSLISWAWTRSSELYILHWDGLYILHWDGLYILHWDELYILHQTCLPDYYPWPSGQGAVYVTYPWPSGQGPYISTSVTHEHTNLLESFLDL